MINNNNSNNNGMINNVRTDASVWDVLKQYKSKWVLDNTRRFSEAELNALAGAEVKAGPHGLSVCFYMKNNPGEYRFISLDSQSCLTVGDKPDPKDLVLKTLRNIADPNIPIGSTTLRVDFEPESANNEAVDFDNPFGL